MSRWFCFLVLLPLLQSLLGCVHSFPPAVSSIECPDSFSLSGNLQLNPAMGLLVSPVKNRMTVIGQVPIQVWYDLTWSGPAEITVAFSTDGGKTYSLIPEPGTLSGDVGKGILPGKELKILWDCREVFPQGRPPQGSFAARVTVVGAEQDVVGWEGAESLLTRARKVERELECLNVCEEAEAERILSEMGADCRPRGSFEDDTLYNARMSKCESQRQTALGQARQVREKRSAELSGFLSEIRNRIVLVPAGGKIIRYDPESGRMSLTIKAGKTKGEVFLAISPEDALRLTKNWRSAKVDAGVVAGEEGFVLRCAWVSLGDNRWWGRPAGTGFKAVSAGGDHVLALKEDGTVWAWGCNVRGALGDGTNVSRATPVPVKGLSNIVSVAAASEISLALDADGVVWAWGDNRDGQLGDGTKEERNAPVRVVILSDIAAVSVVERRPMALKRDGTVWMWGKGKVVPARVWAGQPNGSAEGQDAWKVTAMSGGGARALLLDDSGAVWFWEKEPPRTSGWGLGTVPVSPLRVPRVSKVLAISVGDVHSVVLEEEGTVLSWGVNHYGQVGDGSTEKRDLPVRAKGLSGVTAVSAGGSFTLALKEDGTVWAWGRLPWRQARGEPPVSVLLPEKVEGLAGVRAVSAGGFLGVVLKTDGSLWTIQESRQEPSGRGEVVAQNPAAGWIPGGY